MRRDDSRGTGLTNTHTGFRAAEPGPGIWDRAPDLERIPSAVRYVAGVALLGAAYYAAGKASLALQYTGPVVAIWLPAGVGAATLYLAGLRWVPGVVAGDVALADFAHPGTIAAFTFGNTVEIVLIAVLLRRLLGPRCALDRLRHLGGVLVAIVAGAAISSTVALLTVLADNTVGVSGIPEFLRTWFLADATGSVVVIPLAMAWALPPLRAWRSRAWEGALMIAAVVGLSTLALAGSLPLYFIVFPALIWAALRFELQGATLAVAVAAVMAIGLTANEVGPFVTQSITESVLRTQLYIAVAALTTLCLATVVVERRQASREARRLADEQAALRRVATLVARGLQPGEEFEVVAGEAGRLLGAEIVNMVRFDPGNSIAVVAAWSKSGEHVVPVGSSWPLEGLSTSALIRHDGRPARVDDLKSAPGPIAAMLREHDIHSTVGSPIVVEGRVWGAMIVASTRLGPQPADTEERLAAFSELIATAVANAHAGAEVRRLADEQAALRRVATLVAHETSPPALFAAVAEEVAHVLDADHAYVLRYDEDAATIVGGWSRSGNPPLPLGMSVRLEGGNLSSLVLRSRQAARIDDYATVSGRHAARVRGAGIHSGVGAPIVVEGRIWGFVSVGSTRPQPMPATTEARISEFAELVATAIANAEGHAQLADSRALVAATGDENERLRELDRMKDQFVSAVSHELRTPLTSMVGYLEVVLDGEAGTLNATQRQFLDTVNRSCDRLNRLIEDILFVSRIDAGRFSLERTHTDLCDLAEEAVESARIAAERGGVKLRLSAPDRQVSLPADPIRVGQMLDNLLSNAIKFTADGGSVSVSIEETEDAAVLTVRDTGVGVPSAEMSRLFERFFRASTSSAVRGTGIGLSIVKAIAEAHGGSVSVASKVGVGTTFTVELPLRDRSAVEDQTEEVVT